MTWIPGSGRPLEKKVVTTLVFLPGNFHRQRSLAGYIQSMGSQRVSMTEQLNNNGNNLGLLLIIRKWFQKQQTKSKSFQLYNMKQLI